MKLIARLFKIVGSVIVGAFALAVAVGVTLWGSVIFAVVTTFAGVMAVLACVSVLVHELLFGSKDDSKAP